jgi:hypothetical protein
MNADPTIDMDGKTKSTIETLQQWAENKMREG